MTIKGLSMNNLDNYGCAGGMRCKTPGAPHGHSMQATGNAAARPPARPECSGYSWTAPKVSHVPLAQAQAGMKLAADVCDAGGNSLLAAGAELTEGLIGSLQRRGVLHIQIAEDEVLTPEQLAARRAEVVAHVDAMFRKSGIDPLMAKLRETLLEYRLETLR